MQHPVAGGAEAVGADQVLNPKWAQIRGGESYPAGWKDLQSLIPIAVTAPASLVLVTATTVYKRANSSILSSSSANQGMPEVGRWILMLGFATHPCHLISCH